MKDAKWHVSGENNNGSLFVSLYMFPLSGVAGNLVLSKCGILFVVTCFYVLFLFHYVLYMVHCFYVK